MSAWVGSAGGDGSDTGSSKILIEDGRWILSD